MELEASDEDDHLIYEIEKRRKEIVQHNSEAFFEAYLDLHPQQHNTMELKVGP